MKSQRLKQRGVLRGRCRGYFAWQRVEGPVRNGGRERGGREERERVRGGETEERDRRERRDREEEEGRERGEREERERRERGGLTLTLKPKTRVYPRARGEREREIQRKGDGERRERGEREEG